MDSSSIASTSMSREQITTMMSSTASTPPPPPANTPASGNSLPVSGAGGNNNAVYASTNSSTLMTNNATSAAGNRNSGTTTTVTSANTGQSSSLNREQVYTWIQELSSPDTREHALIELSRKREVLPDLAPLLWNSFGTIAALLQEIVIIYPVINPPTLNV